MVGRFHKANVPDGAFVQAGKTVLIQNGLKCSHGAMVAHKTLTLGVIVIMNNTIL